MFWKTHNRSGQRYSVRRSARLFRSSKSQKTTIATGHPKQPFATLRLQMSKTATIPWEHPSGTIPSQQPAKGQDRGESEEFATGVSEERSGRQSLADPESRGSARPPSCRSTALADSKVRCWCRQLLSVPCFPGICLIGA